MARAKRAPYRVMAGQSSHQRESELEHRAALDAIGAGSIFFSGHDVVMHEWPVLNMAPFDDDLSGEDGHR